MKEKDIKKKINKINNKETGLDEIKSGKSVHDKSFGKKVKPAVKNLDKEVKRKKLKKEEGTAAKKKVKQGADDKEKNKVTKNVIKSSVKSASIKKTDLKHEEKLKSKGRAIKKTGTVSKISENKKAGAKESARIDETKAHIKADSRNEPEDEHRAKTGWEEEKKQSIKSVIERELDKEEKEGRLRLKVSHGRASKLAKSVRGKTPKSKSVDLKEGLKKKPGIKKVIEISESITLKRLSEKINVHSSEILKLLLDMGEIININQSLSRDLIEFISHEYNFKYRIIGFEEKLDEIYKDNEEDLKPRAPIVTVMGHVDHGKTTLLDVIRKTNVATSEQGGITQRIGAYQIEYKGRKITFIDTPGHEAFTSIRARGARVTDIAVIVVAADDGIMPQTVEAINHAKDAGVSIIIAINKIDLPNADAEKIKKGLTEYNLVPEEWGGDTVCIEISAKKKINLDEFLEMILLVADMNEIRGNPDAEGTGIIIESRLDKGLGPLGTVIVKRGKLKVGDSFIAGDFLGKIRSIRDENGDALKEAILSQPVEIVGFPVIPKAGDKLFVVRDEKSAKELLQKKNYDKKMMKIANLRRVLTLEELSELSRESEIIKLKIVLKADSEGSMDAVEKSLIEIKEEKIKIDIIHKAVGAITDSDVMLASASSAIVIGFCVPLNKSADVLHKREGVEVRTYDIIYKLIDDITLAFKGLLKPELKIISKGKAEIRELFKMPKVGVIAGSYILEGEVERGNLVKVTREGKVIYEGRVETLHRFKEDVKKVASGYECGIRLDNFQDFVVGDLLEFFEEK
jgi:translation initiation factor IF-2